MACKTSFSWSDRISPFRVLCLQLDERYIYSGWTRPSSCAPAGPGIRAAQPRTQDRAGLLIELKYKGTRRREIVAAKPRGSKSEAGAVT